MGNGLENYFVTVNEQHNNYFLCDYLSKYYAMSGDLVEFSLMKEIPLENGGKINNFIRFKVRFKDLLGNLYEQEFEFGYDNYLVKGYNLKNSSVAEDRKVGLGHGNLGAMLLSDESKCFAFLAGHESFAAAEGAIGIVKNANKARKEPLRVILNGLGKDAAQIISRINGFTYVQTQFDYYTGKLSIVREIRYSEGERADVRCYGADDVREGVAIMHHEGVDVSITGNSTNPTRFQHPVAGTYKKECIEQGKKYFSVASGGGTGRTLHPDNMGAGPASYGMTDTMGRMHSDAQFAGSSSVPAHVEMMGFLGMGNNPMVGATVAVAVAVEESLKG